MKNIIMSRKSKAHSVITNALIMVDWNLRDPRSNMHVKLTSTQMQSQRRKCNFNIANAFATWQMHLQYRKCIGNVANVYAISQMDLQRCQCICNVATPQMHNSIITNAFETLQTCMRGHTQFHGPVIINDKSVKREHTASSPNLN